LAQKRRRYDTVELVAEIKRERRNGLLLALAGIGILILLLLLYVTNAGSDDVPSAPGSSVPAVHSPVSPATDTAPAPAPAPPKEENPPANKPEEPPPAEKTVAKPEPAAEPATIRVLLSKRAPLWIDGKKVGKVKKHRVALSAGAHEIKAKFGRKMVVQKLNPKAGLTYELRFDARKKKVKVKLKKVGK